MGVLRTWDQYKLLMWKNFMLRKRQKFRFCLEIVLPLLIVILLAAVRTRSGNSRQSRCYFQEKPLSSMGVVQFLTGFICSFRTKCHENDHLNWTEPNKPSEFLLFVENMTDVVNSLPKNLNPDSFYFWTRNHTNESKKLIDAMKYLMIEVLEPFSNSSILSGNITLSDAKKLSTVLCGTKENDATDILMKIFHNHGSNFTERYSRLQQQGCQPLGGEKMNLFNDIIGPLQCGKIYYTPISNFTKKLVKKANTTFETLDYLRQIAIEWRISFREIIENSIINGTVYSNIKELCKRYHDLKICEYMEKYLINPYQLKLYFNFLSKIFGNVENVFNATILDKFVPVQSDKDFENFNSSQINEMLAGLIFDESFQYATEKNVTLLKYSIRMSSSRIKNEVLEQFWTPIPPDQKKLMSALQYYLSGYLLLQQAVDEAFTEIVSDVPVTIGSSIQIMPYPCSVNDKFIQITTNSIPLLLMISWVSSFTFLMKSIVYEKEKRLKEFMRVMGLSNFVHWVAWFTATLSIMLISVIILTFIIKYLKIFEFSSPGVVFILLLSYVIAIISQCFMLSVFFSHANMAGVVGGIIYFILYIPYSFIMQYRSSITTPVYYATGISSQVAFCNALMFIGFWEQITTGIQFSNLFESSVFNLNFSVGHCIVILWIDSIIYLIIMWYIEAVFPGEFGIPRPWYFFFTKSYWCGTSIKLESALKSEKYDLVGDPLLGVEDEPDHLPIGIAIKDLSKKYPKSKELAVNNLSLNFYQSQITAFLGHNGAGKTTTISILTGIYPPSSGTAFILHKDIRNQMDSIRDWLGLCPQHNILFDMLTVEDHVYFYGMLKGMTKEEIAIELPNIVEDVGLTKKLHTSSKKLSGGMKRKLSVAMAFVGDSKVVFLDEPTAGVDPFARRGIWNLLMKYRKADRTIVLTTHHMDEADYLSDRIAIISRGRLKCCGSSVFLKREFGDGYYLIFEKNEQSKIVERNLPSENGHSILSVAAKTVHEFVKRYVPDSQFFDETITQISIILPIKDGFNENNRGYSALFSGLEASLNELQVVSYGLTDATLEEVFLKVADDPSNSSSQSDNSGDIPVPMSRSSLRVDRRSIELENSLLPMNNIDCNGELLKGISLLRQQIWALQIKRFHYTRRNIKGFISELALPILMMILVIVILQMTNRLQHQPPMTIHPWLMMPKYQYSNLYTFYRKENVSTNSFANEISQLYRTDLFESGIRCMDPSVFHLEGYQCYDQRSNWSPSHSFIPMQSPNCNCQQSGMQQCSNPKSGGPKPSSRLMESSDILMDLTGYNVSDHLIKKNLFYKQQLYGGYQFLINDSFGQICNIIGNNYRMWSIIYRLFNNNSSSIFVENAQMMFQIWGRKTSFVRIWVNSKGYVSMPAYINIFNNLQLRSRILPLSKRSKFGIVVSNYPFKYSQQDLLQKINSQMSLELSLSIFLIFALSLIPASFVLFLVEENVTGSKRQQFLSGVNPYVYWISTFLWDVVKYIIPAICIIVIFCLFNYQSYVNSKNIVAFVLLLLFYGIAIIPHMYPFTFFFKTPSTGFVILYSYNVLIGSISTISTFIMDLLEQDDETLKPINNAFQKLFLLWPQYDLGRGMVELSFNYLSYNISGGVMDYNALSWNNAGEKICSLCILFVGWSVILFLIESGLIQTMICGKLRNLQIKWNEMISNEDADVSAERNAVESEPTTNYSLKIVSLSKIYNASIKSIFNCRWNGKRKSNSSEASNLAVNNLTLGVHKGECFGLLGVNGAGKTTTFKMLIGEENITSGECFINGKSIVTNIVGAHADMGYCPQFDALHNLLTCEEELYLYCRIRGIPPLELKKTVDLSMKNLNLTIHATKTTNALSGGNKRKLSTALALIGSPKVIFLDEPTAGMDAGTRRFLWNRIQSLTNDNRSVILTSHNMEECEILCHRLCIMVSGQMKCIGSVQRLKSKFGSDYQVKLRLKPDENGMVNREKIVKIMATEFKDDAVILDENFITLIYRLNEKAVKLSILFDLFESLKRVGDISDFSISQTSLDDMFISFAKNVKTTHDCSVPCETVYGFENNGYLSNQF